MFGFRHCFYCILCLWLWCFVAAIIGLVGSSKAKKGGYKGGIQTAGFVCSIIGLVLCALVFLYCLIILGLAASFLGAFSY